jgi:Lrp/AsnC family leucine-responsive transcriptional regulator
MDETSKKLLSQLLIDSRQSMTQLGKKVRLSRENVHYHIARLQKESIIRQFVTNVDLGALGFHHFTVFVQYRSIRPEQETQFIDALRHHPSISWIGILAGVWSITFDIYAQTLTELNFLIERLFRKFSHIVGRHIVLYVSKEQYFFNKLIGAQPTMTSPAKIISLDVTDRKLLHLLADDARITYAKLTTKIKLSANAIKKRIKRLSAHHLISFSLSLNHKVLGFEWYGIQIKADFPDEDSARKMERFLTEHKRTIFYYQYTHTGEHDYDVGILVRNSDELREFVNEVRNEFSPDIQITNTFVVLREETSHRLPTIVFTQLSDS